MATSRINNPRYVKGRAKQHRGVVDKIITEDEKIGSGGKKRPIITHYLVKKFSPKNASDVSVKILEEGTVKLSDKERMDPEILRYDDIYFGKGLLRTELDTQARKREALQLGREKFVNAHVKFCGIVSPSFDVLCQVFI